MKVVDILIEDEDFESPRSPRRNIESISRGEFKEFIDNFFGDGHGERLGGGFYGLVFSSKDSVSVTKESKKSMSLDQLKKNGYLKYISAMIDYGINSNPHFPKVYSVKFQNTQDYGINKYRYVVEMEKLPMTLHQYLTTHITDDLAYSNLYPDMVSDPHNNIHQFHNLFERIYGKPIDEIQAMFGVSADDNTSAMLYVDHMVNKFQLSIHRIIKRGTYESDIADKKFREALGLISDLNVSLDLHADNFMIRMGKFGIQLVITDPVMEY